MLSCKPESKIFQTLRQFSSQKLEMTCFKGNITLTLFISYQLLAFLWCLIRQNLEANLMPIARKLFPRPRRNLSKKILSINETSLHKIPICNFIISCVKCYAWSVKYRNRCCHRYHLLKMLIKLNRVKILP